MTGVGRLAAADAHDELADRGTEHLQPLDVGKMRGPGRVRQLTPRYLPCKADAGDGSSGPTADVRERAFYRNFPQARSVAHQMILLPARIRTPKTSHA